MDGHPFSLVILDLYSASAFEAFHPSQSSNDLHKAVKVLQKGGRSGIVGDFLKLQRQMLF